MKSNKTKAICLTALCILVCIAICIISFIEEYGTLFGILVFSDLGKWYDIGILGVVGCFIIPLLLRIKHYTQLAKMEKYNIFLSRLILFFSIALSVAIISVILGQHRINTKIRIIQ